MRSYSKGDKMGNKIRMLDPAWIGRLVGIDDPDFVSKAKRVPHIYSQKSPLLSLTSLGLVLPIFSGGDTPNDTREGDRQSADSNLGVNDYKKRSPSFRNSSFF